MAKDLTLAELQAQIAELQSKAQAIIESEKAGVIDELKAKIQQYNISASELGFKAVEAGKPAKSSGKNATVPMYKNKDNEMETWHGGKGRLPLWLQAILKEIQKTKPEAGNPELKQWLDENGYKI